MSKQILQATVKTFHDKLYRRLGRDIQLETLHMPIWSMVTLDMGVRSFQLRCGLAVSPNQLIISLIVDK